MPGTPPAGRCRVMPPFDPRTPRSHNPSPAAYFPYQCGPRLRIPGHPSSAAVLGGRLAAHIQTA